MVSFYVYDITFLVVFTLLVVLFLRTRKKNLSREGWMFMYRTQFGVRAMDWFDKKFHRVLGATRYLILAVSYFLMVIMIYLLGQTFWIYLSQPRIVEVIKAPPIAPLIPYFPELFGLGSIFPPFYFTYFLVALAVVAIVHEFSHGIFMRYSKTKIKSTGLVFLGPILGAFVEEDRKSFHSKDRLNQMAVLGAGVFANVLFAIIFYLLYTGLFYLTFSASGFAFNSYAMTAVNVSSIDNIYESEDYVVLVSGSKTYYFDEGLKPQLGDEFKDRGYYIAFEDSPALNSKLKGVITGIDDYKILNAQDLSSVLSQYIPGDSVVVYTELDGEAQSYSLVLGDNPKESGKAFLGVAYYSNDRVGPINRFMAHLMGFRMTSTYYKPTVNADIVIFFYHLLWWVMLINVLVALFNMLPVGMLDGGRFFYLTVEKFFGKKVGEFAYSWVTRIIFGGFIMIFLIWLYRYALLKIGA